jgi:anti-sigma B factor antagonist
MKIDFNLNNKVLCVALDGRLDTNTAPALESFLNEHSEAAAAVHFNCEKLTYVSSAGLRVLLTAQKKMKGSMKLTNVCELVMEVFEMTGFADVLVIE